MLMKFAQIGFSKTLKSHVWENSRLTEWTYTNLCGLYKKLVVQMLRVSVHAQIATLKVNLTFKGILV